MNLLIDLCKKRSAVADELIETWKADHDEAMLAADLEQLCEECVAIGQLCQRMWETTKRMLFDLKINDVNGTGTRVVDTLGIVIAISRKVHEQASELQKKGRPIAHFDELTASIQGLTAMKDRVAAKWPFVDKKMGEQAMADYKRGAYVDTEELIRGSARHRP